MEELSDYLKTSLRYIDISQVSLNILAIDWKNNRDKNNKKYIRLEENQYENLFLHFLIKRRI